MIDTYGYAQLKIIGFLAKNRPIEASVGVQEDEVLLLSIVQKALDKISYQEYVNIINSWKITRYHKVVDYTLVSSVLALMSIIIAIMIYYQRKLRAFNKGLEARVKEKTRALQKVNENLEEIVNQKVEELIKKDEILTVQSKQAVMGEMIRE